MVFDDEYHIEIICPNCGSKEVIIEESSPGIFCVGSCMKCGFKRQKITKQ